MPSDAQLYARHRAGTDYTDLAREFGLNVDSVRGRISRYRNRQRPDAEPLSPKIVPLLTHSDVQREQPFDMGDLLDRERWHADMAALWQRKDYITVMHPCDRHEPFIDRDIDNAAYELMRLLQPDVVVRGSDEDDNPQISVFYGKIRGR